MAIKMVHITAKMLSHNCLLVSKINSRILHLSYLHRRAKQNSYFQQLLLMVTHTGTKWQVVCNSRLYWQDCRHTDLIINQRWWLLTKLAVSQWGHMMS